MVDRSQRRLDGAAKRTTTQARDPGPYIATVVSHLDSKMMGSLKVRILKTMQSGNDFDEDQNVITAFYASPFYNVTDFRATDATDNHRSTQQSAGAWFVPPDVGNKVLVTFVEGRSDICFWFACVPDDFMNFMVPGGTPATTLVTPGVDGEDQDGRKHPVAEYNKLILDPQGQAQPTRYLKPVNRDAQQILEQAGLEIDEFRGLTTSSSRREVPSAVYGINTPGPLDKRLQARGIRQGDDNSNADVFSHRLGGHQFVMDDGDANILRKGSPANSGPEYIDVENTDEPVTQDQRVRPANELFRIRTRTGHQILLHNTEDLIYIANSRGTAWIELTSNGKIDIYAADSISMHTEREFNITADSNINIQSGRNINFNSSGSIRFTSGEDVDTIAEKKISLKSGSNYSMQAGGFASLNSQTDFGVTSQSGRTNITGATGVEVEATGQDVAILAPGGSIKTGAEGGFDILADTEVRITTPSLNMQGTAIAKLETPELHILGGNQIYITTGGNLDIYSAVQKVETATYDLLVEDTTKITSNTYDLKTAENITISSGAEITELAATSHTLGSSYTYIDSVLNVRGNTIFAGWARADRFEAPEIKSNYGTTGATGGTWTGSAPPEAAEAVFANQANFADPADAPPNTEAPEPDNPAEALPPARVPQHEPWFQHENFNPLNNPEAGQEALDTIPGPLPDPFAQFPDTPVGASRQNPTSIPRNTTAADEGEIDESDIGSTNINIWNENAQIVVNFFNGKFPGDYKDWVGAGIAGALQWECGDGINPGAYLAPNSRSSGLINVSGNTGLGARGICQWRSTRVDQAETFLGKPLLSQPKTDVTADDYFIIDDGRFPTQSYSSMQREPSHGVRLAPANTTLEEQLSFMWEEMNTTESRTKTAILGVASGNILERAARVAEIMNDIFLRSGNPSIQTENGRIPVKTLRRSHAIEIMRAIQEGRSTDPVTDVADLPVVLDEVPPPIQNSGDAPNVLTQHPNGAASRRGPLNPAFINILNKAARDAGIVEIRGTSFGNEPIRRIPANTRVTDILDRWASFPDRTQGAGADMQGSGNSWKVLQANGQYEFRPNGSSWRTGTERHDTALAIDCRLYARVGGSKVLLVPTNRTHKGILATFLRSFAKYGGAGVGVGGPGASYMVDGLFHLDMLGAYIPDNGTAIKPSGWTGSLVLGWSRNASVWPYGNAETGWARTALINGFNDRIVS